MVGSYWLDCLIGILLLSAELGSHSPVTVIDHSWRRCDTPLPSTATGFGADGPIKNVSVIAIEDRIYFISGYLSIRGFVWYRKKNFKQYIASQSNHRPSLVDR